MACMERVTAVGLSKAVGLVLVIARTYPKSRGLCPANQIAIVSAILKNSI